MKTYSIVEDSHYRRFLKEEGYGFVAQIEQVVIEARYAAERLVPMNKGCDMSRFELDAALEQAIKEVT